jgi:hypothetical protein
MYPIFYFYLPPPPRGSPYNMNIQHLYCFSTEFQTTPQTLTQVYIHFHIYYLNVMVKVVACVKIVILYFLPDPLNWTPSTRYAGGTRYVRVYIYPAARRNNIARFTSLVYIFRGERKGWLGIE